MSLFGKDIQHWYLVAAVLIVYDAIVIAFSYFAGLWIRFDLKFSMIPEDYLLTYLKFIPIYIIISIIVFKLFGLYRSIWRFASFNELSRLICATVVTVVCHIVLINILFMRMPISYHLVGMLLQFVFTLGIRFAYRFVLLMKSMSNEDSKCKNVMIIGAGEAGLSILKEINGSKLIREKVRCIIDDNPNKKGRFFHGVLVFGNRDRIFEAVGRFDIEKIYFAIPSAIVTQKRDILNICKETGCELMNLPGIYQLANGDISLSQMKSVDIEDLLGREPIKVDMDKICRYIQGKKVLVTGGGGSIGSEICRQVAARKPGMLIIFDIYENNAYEIQMELKKKYPKLNLVTLIGSVRDSRRIFQVFEKYQPDIVYHAAAHKHVPLMEDSPCEAVKNNTIGTYKTAFAAMMNGTKKFVLISTDKAVNPTNCMGATKRSCEMIVQAFDSMIRQGKTDQLPQLFTHHEMKKWMKDPEKITKLKNTKTEFVAVRFGNVLGSNGSVIPLFKKQIAEGGPVTVTHPDIIRYFMTIPEAVSLVMQAGVSAKGGEIFVLDMGEPVKIDTLARNLIRLSGFIPDVDIKVEYTGLRPGEKLYEEKLMDEEGLKMTDNELIHIGAPIPFDVERFLEQLECLMDAAYKNKEDIKERLADVIATYAYDGKREKIYKMLYHINEDSLEKHG